jgi:hypothetical protein
MRDLHSNILGSRGISPAAALTANGTTTGQTIDVREYGSVEFFFQSGVITDGTFTVTVYEGDASDMSDEAAVADADLLGTEPVFAATDDNMVKRVGYIGGKRYVRAKVVQAGATSGGFISSIVVQGHPKTAPVA